MKSLSQLTKPVTPEQICEFELYLYKQLWARVKVEFLGGYLYVYGDNQTLCNLLKVYTDGNLYFDTARKEVVFRMKTKLK